MNINYFHCVENPGNERFLIYVVGNEEFLTIWKAENDFLMYDHLQNLAKDKKQNHDGKIVNELIRRIEDNFPKYLENVVKQYQEREDG